MTDILTELESIKVGPVFSAYPTTDFQMCPKLWDYKRRWDSPEDRQSTALLLGSAVALGLEAHYANQGRDPLETAESYARANYYEGSDRTEDGLVALVRRGVRLGMATNLGTSEILGVEKWYGNSRPDLVARDQAGKIVVIDHKVKRNLDDRYKEKELLGYETSNQLYGYAWRVAQEYGEPVETAIIHLIVLGPSAYTELHPVRITTEALKLWLTDVSKDWKDMAAGESRRRFSSCVNQYGPCRFWAACHVLGGDETKFEGLYAWKPKRR